MSRPQHGFSFVDMMVVVAVFAIFAAVAVPRFVFLSQASRASDVQALASSVRSSAELTNRIWKSAGKPGELTLDGAPLPLRHGYPTEYSIDGMLVDSSRFDFRHGNWVHQDAESARDCGVIYFEPASADSEPVIKAQTLGC